MKAQTCRLMTSGVSGLSCSTFRLDKSCTAKCVAAIIRNRTASYSMQMYVLVRILVEICRETLRLARKWAKIEPSCLVHKPSLRMAQKCDPKMWYICTCLQVHIKCNGCIDFYHSIPDRLRSATFGIYHARYNPCSAIA